MDLLQIRAMKFGQNAKNGNYLMVLKSQQKPDILEWRQGLKHTELPVNTALFPRRWLYPEDARGGTHRRQAGS